MVYVATKNDGKILNRCDAWASGSVEKMRAWAKDNGYAVLDTEITGMGDMIIWVA